MKTTKDRRILCLKYYRDYLDLITSYSFKSIHPGDTVFNIRGMCFSKRWFGMQHARISEVRVIGSIWNRVWKPNGLPMSIGGQRLIYYKEKESNKIYSICRAKRGLERVEECDSITDS